MTDTAAGLAALTIDLDALSRNWLLLKKKLKPGADCGAVVKADGYGLGAIPVSRTLEKQGCRHFFVATFDEGLSLREALGPDSLIYVFNGPCGATPDDFAAHSLIPVLNVPEDVEQWARADNAPAILHVDTGMNRLGLVSADIKKIGRNPLQKINLRYIMSHMACPNVPDHEMNARQLAAFTAVMAEMNLPSRGCLANSAAILLGTVYHFDLARPGCAIYGINPVPANPNLFAPVVTAKARVLQVRSIDRGNTVGYGARYTATGPVKTATIALGYADGVLRSLSMGAGHVYINGTACPVLGTVTMDLIVVDATHTAVQPGDWAEMIGPHQTVNALADAAGTIGYEILTALGQRYERVYTGG
ncbi:MAG: alanine racemase [Alphaproteobacteria bacterium]|nr:alanine racemase [Alphaproteobacteria bacterium]